MAMPKRTTAPLVDPPIDSAGIPTTYLAYRIVDLMFRERNRSFTPDQLAKFFAARLSDTNTICANLRDADFLLEDDCASGAHKYNLDCRDTQRQARLEKFLLEAELEDLQLHTILPHSPSFP